MQPFSWVIGVFAALLVGCADDGDSNGGVAVGGEQLYEKYCAECHKSTGKGDFFKGIPANADTELGRQQLIVLITQGFPSHQQMPSFPQLSKEQAGQIADHLLTLAADR